MSAARLKPGTRTRRHSPLPACALPLGTGLIFFVLYLPIVVVVIHSFNAAKYGGAWSGFTLEWYRLLFASPEKLAALRQTLVLAVASTALSTVLGTLLGFGLSRYAFPGRTLFSWLLILPVAIPDIVLAIALLVFYSLLRQSLGWFPLGLGTMILSHVTFQLPFVALVIRARLAGMDPALEEAARDLGASPLQTFRQVTLPLLLPGVFAAAALAFTLSVDDFVVSFFTSGPGSTTLPILIYSSVKRGLTPDINALSTLIILVAVLGTFLVTRLERQRESR